MPSNTTPNMTDDATMAEMLATSGPIEVEAPFSIGGVTAVPVSTRLPVPLTDADKADFARTVKHFARADAKNSDTLSVDFPDSDTQTGAERATEYRAKIRLYAELMNLSAGLPVFIDGHMTRETVDAATGKITAGHWVPANKISKLSNAPGSANVTFRFAPHRAKTEIAPVTVSHVSDAANASKAGADAATDAAVTAAGKAGK
jgi:hypothetical protein